MPLSEKESLSSIETALESGTVLRKEPNLYAVWLRDEEVSVHRAAGCLLDPEPGDRVLLVGLAGEPPLILSVLARASGETARLTFPSGLDLAVSGKPLAIRSSEGVALETDASLRVACGDCGIRAGSVSLTARTMSWAGEACSFVAGPSGSPPGFSKPFRGILKRKREALSGKSRRWTTPGRGRRPSKRIPFIPCAQGMP